jgi:ABC-type antimicrobial peptide transport system permease subunit
VLSLKNRKKTFFISGIIIGCALLAILVLHFISSHIAGQVPDQKSCLTWGGSDYAQVSCYTSRLEGFTTDEILKFEYTLNESLKDAVDTSGMTKKQVKQAKKSQTDETQESKWTDGYSGKGTLTVMNGDTSVKGTAYGVGNDFFLIHPLQLLSGGYIDSDNVMKDYILLDEEAAWQLFGSSDVEGMSVTINGDLFIVAGVYRRPDAYFNNNSGNGEITYYVSYEALQKYDETAAITAYEVMMINPVEHYAYDYISKYFQPQSTETAATGSNDGDSDSTSSSGAATRNQLKIIENSDRYSISEKWKLLKNFGLNSMDTDEIVYPYWENVAMAYGSVISGMFFLQILCVIPIVVFVVFDLVLIRKEMKIRGVKVKIPNLVLAVKKLEGRRAKS